MSIKGSKMNLAFGVEIIYEDADFLLNDHDKVGIVGVNGAGKTTLFRLLLGCLRLDSGTITCGKARIGYLPQELVIEHEDCTVEEYLKSGRPIGKLEIELEQIYIALETLDASQQAILLKRMAKVQEQLEYYECYEADTILQNLVENMQITSELMNMRMVELSGGQKSKMAFAQLLYSKPEILLLDEPTNHLDASTKEYVTAYLKQYQGMVLIISHDIDFLDQVTDITMFLDKMTHKTYMYDGNYTTYKKKHAAEQLARERLITQQENEIKELSDFVKRARAATITNHAIHRLGQVRAKTLEKKKEALQTRVKAYKRVKMDIRPKREGALVPLEVTNLSFCYPGQKNLYRDLSFQIKGGERFLVVGENGIGKSTLLKSLSQAAWNLRKEERRKKATTPSESVIL